MPKNSTGLLVIKDEDGDRLILTEERGFKEPLLMIDVWNRKEEDFDAAVWLTMSAAADLHFQLTKWLSKKGAL